MKGHDRELQPNGVALVLGGGGRVGIAYEAGVLRALRDGAGITGETPDLIIGTSAGAVAGAYLRLGRSPESLARIAFSTTPPDSEVEITSRLNMVRAWSTRLEFARRAIGASSVMTRSLLYSAAPAHVRMAAAVVPGQVPRLLGRLFPGWLFDPEVDAVSGHIPEEWPQGELWLTAFDITRRRRVALGSGPDKNPGLSRAVMASCAVPGLIKPVRHGEMVLVDGGTTSVNNIDLAARARPRAVIAVAPMGFDPRTPPPFPRSAARRRFNRSVDDEALRLRRAGADVLVIRPGRDELEHHSTNILASDGNELVEQSAYDATVALLGTERAARVLHTIEKTGIRR